VPNEDWKAKDKKRTYAPEDATGSGTGESGSARIDSDSGLNTDDDGIQPTAGTESGTDSAAGKSRSQKVTPVFPKSKKGPPASKADEGANSGKVPTISIDEKVAWRSAPVRKRIEVRTHSANARLVRLPAYPKSEWLPVDSDSKVASK
jgi:hypothetical protein